MWKVFQEVVCSFIDFSGNGYSVIETKGLIQVIQFPSVTILLQGLTPTTKNSSLAFS